MFGGVISIHLRRFKSVEDFERLFEDNELDNLDPEACHKLMLEGFTKVFIDKETHKIIGFCHSQDKKLIQISEDFILHLKTMNSLTFKPSPNNFSIDSILDKINELGIDSLTKKEKEFLNNNSSNNNL
jgi:hypothetical protein